MDALTGDAGQILWDTDASATDTVEKLVALLKNRYSGSAGHNRLTSIGCSCGFVVVNQVNVVSDASGHPAVDGAGAPVTS